MDKIICIPLASRCLGSSVGDGKRWPTDLWVQAPLKTSFEI